MNKIICPLCKSSNVILKENLNTKDLNNMYKKKFDVASNLNEFEDIQYLKCCECDLSFFNPMVTGDEDFYEKIQKNDWYYVDDKNEYKTAKKYLPHEGPILEIGAGKAAFAKTIGLDRYVGLEFNDIAIEKAMRFGAKLIKESIEIHAYKNIEKYSAIVSFQVLEHVTNPNSFIESCVKALKKEGILIIAVPNHDGICGDAYNSILDMPPHHVSHWSQKSLTSICDIFNLKLISLENERISDNHIIWAKKIKITGFMVRKFNINRKLLNSSALFYFLEKFASIMARLLPIKIDFMTGHTVVAVYQKKW